jgi:hypothetical protein
MSEIEAEIDSAIAVLEMNPAGWLKLSPPEAGRACQAAKDQFVVGNPRAWWLGLKHPAERHEFPSGSGCQFVQELVPAADDRCWFIPETEEDDLPVYDVLIADVPRVLGRCRFFEYYLVGKNLGWLVVENDHNEVLVVELPRFA